MNAQEAIAYIHSVSWKGSVPGLSRTRALLEKMGNPERKLQFIHIAGTNGKGSTAAMLASVLHAAGYRAGLFTSPYITRFEAVSYTHLKRTRPGVRCRSWAS